MKWCHVGNDRDMYNFPTGSILSNRKGEERKLSLEGKTRKRNFPDREWVVDRTASGKCGNDWK
jgi:hypothetical protein